MNKLVLNKRNLFPTTFPGLMPTDIWQEVDKLFNDAFGIDTPNLNLRLQRGFPKGDVFLEGDNVVVELLLAGYKKEQLSVRIEENSLVVSAVKSDESDGEKGRQARRSAFTKTFPNFADRWDLLKADVSYTDGLLRIEVSPKEKQKSQSQELNIK